MCSWWWSLFHIRENKMQKCRAVAPAALTLLHAQIVQLCRFNKAHLIIMLLRHIGLKALVMNNYGTGNEHGGIQSTEGVGGGGGTVEKTGVCHELYIWRNATAPQMNAFHIVSCLQSPTAPRHVKGKPGFVCCCLLLLLLFVQGIWEIVNYPTFFSFF